MPDAYCTKSRHDVWAHHPHPTLGNKRLCVKVADWEDQESIDQSAHELQDLLAQARAEGAQAGTADEVCDEQEDEDGEARSADQAADVDAEQARGIRRRAPSLSASR